MEETAPLHNPAGHAGLGQNLKSLVASFAQFLETRLKLATREGKAAAWRLVAVVACLVIAFVLSLLGFIYLMVFAIVGLAYLLGVWWLWVALGIALLHFAIALLCLVIARAKAKHPMMQDTASVLKEDSEWLKNLDRTNRP